MCQLKLSDESSTKPGLPRKKRRRRQNATEGEANISQDEIDRRTRQRQLRELAIKLRGEGKEYRAKKYRYSKFLPLSLRDGHKPRRSVQVIIVPIFWNRREDEKESVLEAASTVQTALRGAGIKADTDTTHKLTPGQKFRHWEEKGVIFRVEIGPQEAETGTCIFASCSKPGEVAKKEKVAIGQQLVKRACQALGMAFNENEGDVQDVQQGPAAEGQHRKRKSTAEHQQVRELGQEQTTNEARKLGHNAHAEQLGTRIATASVGIHKSGDDLDGDFEVSVPSGDVDKDEDGMSRKKGKKTKPNVLDKSGSAKKNKIIKF